MTEPRQVDAVNQTPSPRHGAMPSQLFSLGDSAMLRLYRLTSRPSEATSCFGPHPLAGPTTLVLQIPSTSQPAPSCWHVGALQSAGPAVVLQVTFRFFQTGHPALILNCSLLQGCPGLRCPGQMQGIGEDELLQMGPGTGRMSSRIKGAALALSVAWNTGASCPFPHSALSPRWSLSISFSRSPVRFPGRPWRQH